MLPYALAIAVGASSSVLFLTAFFLKDIHRQDDFFWSGIGLFYALVLWFCATSITGAVLLGQLAAVALLLAYFWQVIKLRGAIANPEKMASLDKFSVVSSLRNWLGRSQSPIPQTAVEEKSNSLVEKEQPSFPLTTVTKETVAEAPSDSDTIVETKSPTDIQKVTPPATATAPGSDSSTIETAKEDTSAIKTPSQTPEEQSTQSSEPETIEVTVETTTIVEEETNWADEDEVEDISVSSVKVTDEAPSPSESESQTTIEAADTPSEDHPNNTDKGASSQL